jgi:hypothetical protein
VRAAVGRLGLHLQRRALVKFSKSCAIFLSFLLFATAGAFAESKTEHNVTISNPVQVGSTQLNPGQYKVSWAGMGPAVQVEFQQHGKIVATTNAKLVEQNQTSPYDDVVTDKRQQVSTLKEIDFHNQKEALVFANPTGM